MLIARLCREALGRGSPAAAAAAAAVALSALVACASGAATTTGSATLPSAQPSPPKAATWAARADLQRLAALLNSVSGYGTFTTAALLSQQVRQLRSLTSQSDEQLILIKTARTQAPLNCPQLAGYAATAAGLGSQQQPLLRAIPAELQALTGEINPATSRVAALQREVNQFSAQLQSSTDASVVNQLAAYQTDASLLTQNLNNAQLSLGTIPIELGRFTKQYNAAVRSPTAVSSICRPRGTRRTG